MGGHHSCSYRPFNSAISFLLLCVTQSPLYGLDAYSWTAPLRSSMRSTSCFQRFSLTSQLHVSSAVLDHQEDEMLQISSNSGILGAWIPVGSASALAPLSPTSITVMNREFAVWKDKLTSRWSVLLDECPHRLAPLSQGRINPKSGCIECPYHGWEFDDQGRNKNIPQWQSSESAFAKAVSDPKSKLHATSFPVHLSGDLIFTFLPTSFHNESFPITLTPEEMYDGLSATTALNRTFFVRDLPYSFDFLVENFFCPAHIPFAHHGLQGVRDDGSPIPMKIIANNFTTVEVEYQDRIRNKTRLGIVSFCRPSYYHFRVKDTVTNEFNKVLEIYCVPIRAGQSRVFITNNFRLGWVPTWISHAITNRFLNTDTWLHDAERRIRNRGHGPSVDVINSIYVLPTSSDIGVRAFRDWWNKYGMQRSPPHSFGPATIEQLGSKSSTRKEQIDPWRHHTKNCDSCRRALNSWKQIEKVSLFFSFLAIGVGISGTISSVAVVLTSLAGLLLHYCSKSVCAILEGNPFPSGVADRSAAAMKDS